jgi:hypothetical protein
MRSCWPDEPYIDVRLVASVDDAKNCEESDMPIPAGVTLGHNLDPRPSPWHLTSGSYAVNLVLQILETR